MATDTMPQLASAERIGWSPITANLYGVPAFLSGDTPLSSIQNFYRAYVQGQGRSRTLDECLAAGGGPECLNYDPQRPTSGRDWEKAIRGIPGQTGPTTQAPYTPPFIPDGGITAPIDATNAGAGASSGGGLGGQTGPCRDQFNRPVPCVSADAVGGDPLETKCGYLDIACHIENVLGSDVAKDIGKRAVLLVFALAVLIVAIISLR
jgi:hypothetical protein